MLCPGDGFDDGDCNGIGPNVRDPRLHASRPRLECHHGARRRIQFESQLSRVDVDDGPKDVGVHHDVSRRVYRLCFEEKRITDREGEGLGLDLERHDPTKIWADDCACRDGGRDDSCSSKRLQSSLAYSNW